MKEKFFNTRRTILFIILGILIIVYISNKFRSYKILQLRRVQTQEQSLLHKEVRKLLKGLKDNKDSLVYSLFDSAFIKANNLDSFISVLHQWRNGRKIKKIKIQKLTILGRGGHITSWVTFDNREKVFLYQSWIKTKTGWKILWLSKLLPQSFAYAENDSNEIKKIKLLALEQLITRQGIRRVIGENPIPETLIIALAQNSKKLHLRLQGYTIREWTHNEIRKNYFKTGALFFLEFATIRILNDIATCYVDIKPLYLRIPRLSRNRGLQLYFIKENNSWQFDSYGSRW
ncbi:MAG: hypothetical protein N2201_07070 [candidate division WOR-3 bacterium]|nr:hypothetical protein [candidate division WOR-3 bacterium]